VKLVVIGFLNISSNTLFNLENANVRRLYAYNSIINYDILMKFNQEYFNIVLAIVSRSLHL
jgi:hypothetical protein